MDLEIYTQMIQIGLPQFIGPLSINIWVQKGNEYHDWPSLGNASTPWLRLMTLSLPETHWLSKIIMELWRHWKERNVKPCYFSQPLNSRIKYEHWFSIWNCHKRPGILLNTKSICYCYFETVVCWIKLKIMV